MTPADVGETRGAGSTVPLYVYVLCAAIAAQFMSGSAQHYGLPVSLDRPLLLLGLVLFLAHPDSSSVRWSVRPLHLAMLAALGWCVGSMMWFGGLRDSVAVFAFADSFGAVPFLLFLLAPVVFATPARRDILVITLTVLGLYLGWVSVAEGLRLYGLVFPSGLVQPSHAHFDRAIGPSLQVASNGLALLGCAVAAGLCMVRRSGLLRRVAALSCALCLAGAFFTLTRSIWLATLLAAGAVAARERRLRRPALVAAGVVTLLVGAALLLPSVAESVFERAETSRSVYDRLNAGDAAVRIVGARPLTGVGFGRFHLVESDWVWQSPTYPLTTMGIDVHNVLLGYAAELGLPGTLLWLTVVVLAGKAALTGPRTPPDLPYYRLAALAYGVAWVTVAMFVPLKYAFPTSLLWVLLGMVADPRAVGLSGRGPDDATMPSTPVVESTTTPAPSTRRTP